ncbi:unnamed protein product [Cutaneotrichosporon oleaginosum]
MKLLPLILLFTLATAAPTPSDSRSRGCRLWTAESCHWVCFAYGGGALRPCNTGVECICHSAERIWKART